MDVTKYLTVLVVFCLKGGETGGHGEKHHDHVRLHIPEFIHHDYHKKVITIHHHHHNPKKEHHHHHHHHHKPQIPHGHHYHHQHKKFHTTSHSVSKGHQGHHGHHGHNKHYGHHAHHGHQGHSHKHSHHGHGHGGHHHDTPSVSYDPVTIPLYENDISPSYSPTIPEYGTGTAHQIPKVHGVTHTIKQVKVYDSLPGTVPGSTGNSNGYEVTEQGEEADDDIFTSVNDLQQVYPATYGYLRSAGEQTPSQDPFAQLIPQNSVQPQNNDLFGGSFQPAEVSGLQGIDSFTGTAQSDPFSSSAPAGDFDGHTSAEFPAAFRTDLSLDNQPISFTGVDGDVGTAFTASDEGNILSDTPVSFAREAGVQQTTKTGGVETIVY